MKTVNLIYYGDSETKIIKDLTYIEIIEGQNKIIFR